MPASFSRILVKTGGKYREVRVEKRAIEKPAIEPGVPSPAAPKISLLPIAQNVHDTLRVYRQRFPAEWYKV